MKPDEAKQIARQWAIGARQECFKTATAASHMSVSVRGAGYDEAAQQLTDACDALYKAAAFLKRAEEGLDNE